MSGSGAQHQIIARPGRDVSGTVTVPGDKSISHRSLMFGALADGTTTVTGFLAGEDCIATMNALRALGVEIEVRKDGRIVVHGVGLHGLQPAAQALDMGNSGTGLRLMAGLMAGQSFVTELTGDSSLRSRPMERIAAPLRQMGADVVSTDGKAPLHISGGALKGIAYDSPVASAQVKSAVLLAGLYAEGETRVQEPAITRDHTERMLQAFGVDISSADLCVRLQAPEKLTAIDICVPGDLSSAAFVLAAGCLSQAGPVRIENVGINPTRTGVLDILRLMGADIVVSDEGLAGAEPVATLTAHPSKLRGIEVPPELVPLAIDEFPLLFALAACAEGETVISGAEELRHKESDRIAAMAAGLQALGVQVVETPDGARIQGGSIAAGTIDSKGDHRIAMAFSVIAMCADGPVTVLDTANVATSFPGFVALMRELGLNIESGGADND